MVSYNFDEGDREPSMSNNNQNKPFGERFLGAKLISELPEAKDTIRELEERFKLEMGYAKNLLNTVDQGSYVNEHLDDLILTKEKLKSQHSEVVDLAQNYKFITGKTSEDFEKYTLFQDAIFNKLDEEIDRTILRG